MDTSFDSLKQNAYDTSSNVSQMESDAPSLLSQLKQNLVGIFTKDNPVIGARDAALTDYLKTPSQTRADILPSNMPTVEGRNLTLSPTQQDSIVSGRKAAAFAPLAGYNEILKAMYGNIGDMVQGAGGIYDSTLKSEQNKAANALDLYRSAISEYSATHQGGGGSGIDLASIIQAIRGTQGSDVPDLSKYESIVKPAKQAKPAPKVNLSSVATAANIPAGNQLASVPQSNGNGEWLLSPFLNWLGGFKAPKTDFASLDKLGLQ
jgi:hypothetical protein